MFLFIFVVNQTLGLLFFITSHNVKRISQVKKNVFLFNNEIKNKEMVLI